MELFRGGAIALGFKFLSVLIGYIFFWLLARWLGADGVGVFSTAWTILMIGTVLGKLGFDTSIVKFIAGSIGKGNPHHVPQIYRTSISIVGGSAIIVAIIIFFFAPQLSDLFFKSDKYIKLVRIIGVTVIPLSILNINAESLKSLKNITGFSIFQNGSIYLLTLLLLFIFSSKGLNKQSSIYALSIAVAILLVLSFIMLNNNFKTKIHGKSGQNLYVFNFKKTLRTSLPMLLTNSLFLIMSWMDILMLSAFKSEAEVGVYNTALKISSVIMMFLIAINTIALPKFAELYESGKFKNFERVVKQTTFLNFGLSFPVFLLILVIPGFLLGIFGAEFTTGKNSLIILSVGQIFCAFSGSVIHVLNMTGKENAAKNILLFTAILNFVLNYWLVQKYGINGAAIATAISLITLNLMAEIVIYKHLKFLTYPFISWQRIKAIRHDLFKRK